MNGACVIGKRNVICLHCFQRVPQSVNRYQRGCHCVTYFSRRDLIFSGSKHVKNWQSHFDSMRLITRSREQRIRRDNFLFHILTIKSPVPDTTTQRFVNSRDGNTNAIETPQLGNCFVRPGVSRLSGNQTISHTLLFILHLKSDLTYQLSMPIAFADNRVQGIQNRLHHSVWNV